MPLSEHEQRLLQQMEKALSEQDPEFASHMQGAGVHLAARDRIALGGAGVLIGIVLVLVGVTTTMWLGAFGFALMVASAAFAVLPGERVSPWALTRIRGMRRPQG